MIPILKSFRHKPPSAPPAEMFLNAAPLDYCAFTADEHAIYSTGFPSLFGLESVKTLADIQDILRPADAAALENLFVKLQEDGSSFSLTVHTTDDAQALKLTGKHGQGEEESAEALPVIWAEDITHETQKQERHAAEQTEAFSERDRLQGALDALPFPLWMRDDDEKIVWCNQAYAAALDVSPATVIAEQKEIPFKSINRKNGTKRNLSGKALKEAAEAQEPKDTIKAHAVIGGSRRLLSVKKTSLSPLGLTLGTAQDVTREEELETEGRRHTAAHRELLEQLATAIGIFDPAEQRLEFYNTAFSDLWGLEEPYLVTRPSLGDLMEKLREMRVLPEQADFRKFKKSWLSLFTDLLKPHEDMLHLPDGRTLRMTATPHPMGGLMMTFEDVTRRLALESSYNTLVAVQKDTIDHLAEGVAVCGGDGRLKLWNPAFGKLWKFKAGDLDGEPHINTLVPAMSKRFAKKDRDTQQDDLLQQALDRSVREALLECKDGTLIACSTMPLPDGGVLITHVDVTDTVRVEKALREKNAALEAAERVKLDFLANVSYQLRTPLNSIMGFAEMLQAAYFGKLNKKQEEHVVGIREAGDNLLSLINDILDLATIEAGYMDLEKDEMDVYSVLKGLQNLTESWGHSERIKVVLDCREDIGTVPADERRIKQILLNLIRNAFTHTPAEGTITLHAGKAKDQSITISVSDTGPGISATDHARVFAPFERIEGVGRGRAGAGLGLTLVKTITELHGGKVKMEGGSGEGTTVRVMLPG